MSIALSTIGAPTADACLCEQLEDWGFLAPENGRLPANAAGIAWHKSGEALSANEVLVRVSVEMERNDEFHEVPATVKVVPAFPGVYAIGPKGGLKAGATYRFTDRRDRRRGVPAQVLATIDSASLEPATPLVLKVRPLYSETIAVASAGGMCWVAQWVAQALIEVTLPEGAGQWQDQLLYRTLVDSETWYGRESLCDDYPPGRSWKEIGEDLVYSACPDPSGASPGESGFAYGDDWRRRRLEPTHHFVKMQAFLPGADIVLETETLKVDLSCPGPVEN